MSTKPRLSLPMRTVDNEILTALCVRCECCLANEGHCWTCHTTVSIKDLCGCLDCYDQAKDFNARDAERVAARRVNLSTKARLKAITNGS